MGAVVSEMHSDHRSQHSGCRRVLTFGGLSIVIIQAQQFGVAGRGQQFGVAVARFLVLSHKNTGSVSLLWSCCGPDHPHDMERDSEGSAIQDGYTHPYLHRGAMDMAATI